jgi:hypothetical protein
MHELTGKAIRIANSAVFGRAAICFLFQLLYNAIVDNVVIVISYKAISMF